MHRNANDPQQRFSLRATIGLLVIDEAFGTPFLAFPFGLSRNEESVLNGIGFHRQRASFSDFHFTLKGHCPSNIAVIEASLAESGLFSKLTIDMARNVEAERIGSIVLGDARYERSNGNDIPVRFRGWPIKACVLDRVLASRDGSVVQQVSLIREPAKQLLKALEDCGFGRVGAKEGFQSTWEVGDSGMVRFICESIQKMVEVQWSFCEVQGAYKFMKDEKSRLR